MSDRPWKEVPDSRIQGSREHVLDLWPAPADPAGTLRSEYTRDHVHLTGEGCRAWVDVLRPVLAEFVPQP